MAYKQTLNKIEKQVKAHFDALKKENPAGRKGEKRVALMRPFYDQAEVMQVVDSLLRQEITMNQSKGNKVQKFEDLWKGFIGKKEGIMTNSGSSANLMALQLLTNPLLPNRMKPGDEVITPALTWTTTVSPIWAVGCKPVFVDVDPSTFVMKVEEIEKAITPKTRAIMPVHLLGYPCDMPAIMELAKKHDLFVIEDCCEAHGAEIDGRKVGSFGHLATFSFFFSHHLSTMEGGMVLTDDVEYAEIIRTMRSQGVIRNCRNDAFKERYYKDPRYKDIQRAYLFSNIGFNVRPTELNGGFGLEQFKKFPKILKARIDNAAYFLKAFKRFEKHIAMPMIGKNVKHGWFGIPVYVKESPSVTRKELEAHLNSKGIETRQIMAGDVTLQPAYGLFESRVVGDLKHTKAIHKSAFFFGNHPLIRKEERAYVVRCMEEFFRGKK
jgi:CDP-6-deoxy-D-xylo-4-hexulose-3-dehydrase